MRIVMMMAIHSLVTTVIMGVGIVAELVSGIVEGRAIALAALAGFVLTAPVTWIVMGKLVGKSPAQG